MVNILRLALVSLTLIGLWSQIACAAQVKAVVDRQSVAFGESLTLELRVNGSPDDDPDLAPLERQWEVVSRSQSSQIQMINGSFSRSVVYSLALMPREEGTLTIPAVCFGSDCSLPLKVHVSSEEQGVDKADSRELFLEAEVEPKSVYSQQQLLLKVRLLHRVDLLQGSLTEPQVNGVDAVVQKLGDDLHFETRRKGILYQVVERSYAIFPQTSGMLEISPLRFDGELSRGTQRFDLFASRGQRLRKLTEAVKVEVKQPPGDLGGRPWIPARALSLHDDWQAGKPQLTVGEPATRTLTLRAEGVAAAQLPELRIAPPAEFKVYPDQPGRSDAVAEAGVTGMLQQKIALVPTHPGRFLLPEVDVDWWDVRAEQWRTAHLDAIEVDVSPAPGTAVANRPIAPPSSSQPSQGETVQVPEAQNEEPRLQPLASANGQPGIWPWLSLCLGVGWLATLLVVWRRKQKQQKAGEEPRCDAPLLREKNARQAVIEAARNNNALATRRALVVWCQTLWPDASRGNLETLGQLTPQLQSEIDRLSRSLYSANEEQWIGKKLVEAVEQWQKLRLVRDKRQRLPSLYPHDSASLK